MMDIISMVLLALMTLAAVVPQLFFRQAHRQWSEKTHRAICIAVCLLGCVARLAALGSLPGGMSAEEALVGVQAKALIDTGRDASGGGWPALFSQWNGETTGPLLSVLCAPFVALFGLNAWTVRLPLALCSCAALPAAYGVGKALSGRRAGRWCLTLYALCPYFVLSARLTAGANLAVCLFPIALWALLRGLEKAPALYLGAALMGLLPYAQEMYAYIVPVGMLAALALGVRGGCKKRHAVLAGALCLTISLPALLTAWVNLTGGESFTLLGLIRIPSVEGYAPAWVYGGMSAETTVFDFTLRGLFQLAVSAFFGVMTHENIASALLAPQGLYALYLASLPVAALGAVSLMWRYVKGSRMQGKRGAARAMTVALAVTTVAALFAMGQRGAFTDAAALHFTVLLCAAGLCRMERSSCACGACALGVYACSFALLCAHLFGGAYQEGANVYFDGLRDAVHEARMQAEESDQPVVMTTAVYPHREPAAAAQMLLRYALAQDGASVDAGYSCAYIADDAALDAGTIYILRTNQADTLDTEAFEVREYGNFVLLLPFTD